MFIAIKISSMFYLSAINREFTKGCSNFSALHGLLCLNKNFIWVPVHNLRIFSAVMLSIVSVHRALSSHGGLFGFRAGILILRYLIQYILMKPHYQFHICTYFSYPSILFEFSLFWFLNNIRGGRAWFALSELYFWAGGFIPGKS